MNDRPPAKRTAQSGDRTSRENAAARRRALERYRKNQRIRKIKLARFYVSRVLLFYVVFLIAAAAVFLIKRNSFPKTEVKTRDYFIVSLEQDELSTEIKGKTIKKESLTVNGKEYLPLSLLDGFATFAEGGDSSTRTLYLKSGSACFEVGTGNVNVNGCHTTLEYPSIIRDGDLCVTSEFFERCLCGITIQLDEKNDRWSFSRTGEIRFVMSAPEAEESLSYEDLKQRIRIEREKLGIE